MFFLFIPIVLGFNLSYSNGTENNTIRAVAADFGFIPYGHSFEGKVYVANGFDLCQPFETENTTLKKAYMGSILAGCSFVHMASVAEANGAQLVILVHADDNIDRFLLISDHTSQVKIPVIVIARSDGLKLQELQNVIITIFFDLLQTDSVNLRYLMTSIDTQSYQFLKQFHYFYNEMQGQLEFEPIYAQYWLQEAAMHNFTISSEMCVSGGRYCGLDPDGNGPLIGRDIILEDLRQLCIFRQSSKKWWYYELSFFEQCVQQLQNVTDLNECSRKVQVQTEIDVAQVQKCVNESFVGPDYIMDDNTLLAQQREYVVNRTNPIWPSLIINNVLYRGDLYIENQYEVGLKYTKDNFAVLEAICDSFTDSTRPNVCKDDIIYEVGKNTDEHKSQDSSSQQYIWAWIGLIVFIFVCMAVGFFFFRRKIKIDTQQDLKEQVGLQMSQYYKFTEKEEQSKK